MYYLKNDIANGNIVMFQTAGINGTDSTVNVPMYANMLQKLTL